MSGRRSGGTVSPVERLCIDTPMAVLLRVAPMRTSRR
jgi:hypothetical protein